jgi:hypothetical protein
MLNDRLTAARRIAGELFPLERELEATFLRANRLTTAIVEGRIAARMPIGTGQDSLNELTAATSLLVQARARIAAAHAALADERLNAGLRQFGMGDVDECPPATKPSGLLANQDNSRVA